MFPRINIRYLVNIYTVEIHVEEECPQVESQNVHVSVDDPVEEPDKRPLLENTSFHSTAGLIWNKRRYSINNAKTISSVTKYFMNIRNIKNLEN